MAPSRRQRRKDRNRLTRRRPDNYHKKSHFDLFAENFFPNLGKSLGKSLGWSLGAAVSIALMKWQVIIGECISRILSSFFYIRKVNNHADTSKSLFLRT